MNIITRFAISIWAALLIATPAQSELTLRQTTTERVAIVVGNQDYGAITDLANARRDATDMAALLREYGFLVYDGYDLDRQAFEDLLRQAMLNVREGAEVVFFYAGHGIQIGRRNYLLPVDVEFESIYDLPIQSITLDRVIEGLATRGSTHLAIVDACRANPFPDVKLAGDLAATLFETKAGFDVFSAPLNSLVAFSTSPGALAYDGEDGGNSPYTSAILTAAQGDRAGDILNMFAGVRAQVYQTTQGRQVPWESSTLVKPFTLLPVEVPEYAVAALSPLQPIVTGAIEPADSTELAAVEPKIEAVETVAVVEPEPTELMPPLPDRIAVTMPLTREVALREELAAALGIDLTPALSRAPGAGQVLVGSGTRSASVGMKYLASLSEQSSARMDGYSMTDNFQVQVAMANQTRNVEVDLTLEADACDVEAGDALDLDGVGLFRLPNELNVPQALAACEAAVAAYPETPRFRYQLGRAKQAAGRFEEAYADFAAASDAGHVRALNALGYLHFTTRIDRDLVAIELNEAKARDLLEQGVAAGDPFAIHTLGQRLLRFGENEAEKERGFDLLNRSAELGHTYSMNELGFYFLTPNSDQYLPERGMRYLEASAARNDIYGYHNLGLVALQGLDGNAPDYQRAYSYFERAALGGHPFAPSAIGRMIVNGQRGGASDAEAVRWYDSGLERGDGWGGANAASIILRGSVRGLGPADAGARAAKAMHLASSSARDESDRILKSMSDRSLGTALQIVLRDAGERISVDGIVGRGTLGALERAARRNGLRLRGNSPRDRLLLAAKIYWAEKPTRPDLF